MPNICSSVKFKVLKTVYRTCSIWLVWLLSDWWCICSQIHTQSLIGCLLARVNLKLSNSKSETLSAQQRYQGAELFCSNLRCLWSWETIFEKRHIAIKDSLNFTRLEKDPQHLPYMRLTCRLLPDRMILAWSQYYHKQHLAVL